MSSDKNHNDINETKKCTQCAEEIKADAKICRFCKSKQKPKAKIGCGGLVLLFIVFIILISMIGSLSSTVDGTHYQQPNTVSSAPQKAQKISINLCKSDPTNADYWASNRINLFAEAGNKGVVVGRIPACSDVSATIITRKTDGVTYVYVSADGQKGWQTERLILGSANF